MGYAKCTDCGTVVRYRAVKGSRVRYMDCPRCGNQEGLVGATWEEYKEAENMVDIRYV